MEGQPLPAVTLTDERGAAVPLAKLRAPYLLYFYPKDDTPGCTKEACGIRDQWADFKEAGLDVYGVSADDAASHAKFRDKYQLPFRLLTADTATLEKLGVWKEKNMYGKKYFGIARESFLVGPGGTVLKHYPKVKPEEHAQEVLADVSRLLPA
ncbi:MAG: peroxiredoxin [Thermoplasmatota archaeon]